MIHWYNLPKKTILDLLFLMKISQSPSKITAGKFIILSLNSFSVVSSNSFIVSSILNTILIVNSP